MFNPIEMRRRMVQERIEKSFDNEIEKAHKDGDMHPNGKWVWVSSAAGGKGDWRTINGRAHQKHNAAQGSASGGNTPEDNGYAEKFKKNFKDASDDVLNKVISGKIQGTDKDKRLAKEILDERKSSAEGEKSAKKIIDLLKVSSSKYSDIKKVTAFKTDKGNWAIDYDGANTGIILNGSKLSEKGLKAAGVKIEGANVEKKGVKSDVKIDETTIDQSEYDSQLKMAKQVDNSSRSMAKNIIQGNIDKTKKKLQETISSRPGAKATIANLQKDLTKFISQKKAVEDAGATDDAKSKTDPRDKTAQDAGFNNYEEMSGYQEYVTAKNLLKKPSMKLKSKEADRKELEKQVADYEKDHADVIKRIEAKNEKKKADKKSDDWNDDLAGYKTPPFEGAVKVADLKVGDKLVYRNGKTLTVIGVNKTKDGTDVGVKFDNPRIGDGTRWVVFNNNSYYGAKKAEEKDDKVKKWEEDFNKQQLRYLNEDVKYGTIKDRMGDDAEKVAKKVLAKRKKERKEFIDSAPNDFTEEQVKTYLSKYNMQSEPSAMVKNTWNTLMGRIGSTSATISVGKGKFKEFSTHDTPDWRPIGEYRYSTMGWDGKYFDIDGTIQSWDDVKSALSETENMTIRIYKHPKQ